MKNLMILLLSALIILSAVPTALADETEETNAPAENTSGSYTVFLKTDVYKDYQWYAWTWGEGTDRWVKSQYNGDINKFENVDSNLVFACTKGAGAPDWNYMTKQTVDIKLDGINNMVTLNGDENSEGKLTGYLSYYNEADWTMSTAPTNTAETIAPPTEEPTDDTSQTQSPATESQQTQATAQTLYTQPTSATEYQHTESTQKPTGPTQPTIIRPTTESTTPSETSATIATRPPATDPAPKLNLSTVTVKCGKVITLKVSNKGSLKVTYSSNKKSVASVNSKGKVSVLKKGVAKITANVGGKKLYCTFKVTTSPKLSKSSVTIKKGKYKYITVIGKVSTVNNVYKNTSKAKILSKKNAIKLKVKALKKGKTTLKIKVNGVWLKLKVRIK